MVVNALNFLTSWNDAMTKYIKRYIHFSGSKRIGKPRTKDAAEKASHKSTTEKSKRVAEK